MKAQIYLPTAKIATVDLDPEFNILPNFKVKEIANNQAREDVKLVIPDERAWKLLRMLQLTRYKYGSMTLNSVYRTQSFNKTLEGADPRSCHLKCWAFDWSLPYAKMSQLTDIRTWWQNLCNDFGEIGAINYYTWGVHCEIGSNIQYGQTGFAVRNHR